MAAKNINSLYRQTSQLLFMTVAVTFVGILASLLFFVNNKYLQESYNGDKTNKLLQKIKKDYLALKNEDQYKKNQSLQSEISSIEKNYGSAVKVYEQLLSLKEMTKDTSKFDAQFTLAVTQLSDRNFSSASATIVDLSKKIASEKSKIAASFQIPANVPSSNTPPGAGYQRQSVHTQDGDFLVDVIAADMNSTRVVVDTASDSDCGNNCPVLSLGDYVSRNGAFAGVNGSYFCPADYPSCAGKTNTFDTLLMNKNKYYFNSGNNVYSTVPAVIFSGNSARYVTQSLQWGRDTGVDSVIANQPLLVLNGNVVFSGDDEAKRASQSSRSFVGSTGSTAYIGVVHNVNAVQMARVLATMGIQNALNLDSGGSTALWSGGYRVGPGRNIPNAVLFVHK